MILSEVFHAASNSSQLSQLKAISIVNPDVKKIIDQFKEKYPRIGLTFSLSEIEELFASSVSQDTHSLKIDQLKLSALEKLLVSILWKNGHIDRIKPVLNGIVGVDKSDSNFGVIFKQFGKSMIDTNEPIIDQHTIRAFCLFADTSKVKSRKIIPKKAAFLKSDQPLIDAYRLWFKNVLSKVTEDEKQEFKYLFDKVLFAIGKLN